MCALQTSSTTVDPTKVKTPVELCTDNINLDIQRIQGLIINSQIKYNQTMHELRANLDNYNYSLIDVDYDRYNATGDLLSLHLVYATEYVESLVIHINKLTTILSDWLMVLSDAINHCKTFQAFTIEFPINMLNKETTADHLYEYQRNYSDSIDKLMKQVHEISVLLE